MPNLYDSLQSPPSPSPSPSPSPDANSSGLWELLKNLFVAPQAAAAPPQSPLVGQKGLGQVGPIMGAPGNARAQQISNQFKKD